MQMKTCLLSDIKPNTYNPNTMDADLFEVLVNNIKRDGMLQPILINAEHTIIDGEHRWKASKKAGLTEIDCVIVETSEEEAKIKSIAFNHIRGVYEFDALSKVINSLTGSVELTDIVDQTGMTTVALSSLIGSIKKTTIDVAPQTEVVLGGTKLDEAPPPADDSGSMMDTFFGAEPMEQDAPHMPGMAVDFKDPISDMFGGSTPIDSTPAPIEVDFKISCTPPELKLIRAAVRKYQSTFEEDDKPSFGTSVAEVCTVYIELIDGDDVD